MLAIAVIDRRQAQCRRDDGAAGRLRSIMVNDRVDLVSLAIVGIDFGQHLLAAYLGVVKLQVSATWLCHAGQVCPFAPGGYRLGLSLAIGIVNGSGLNVPIGIFKHYRATVGQAKSRE